MKAVYPLCIVLLSVLLLAFLISDSWQDAKSRRATDDAIQVAKDWQATAEQWEQIAKDWERIANRCAELKEVP